MWWVGILKYNLIDVRAVDADELYTLSHENFNFVVEFVEWKVENTTLFAPLCLLTIQPSNEQQMPIKSSDRRLDDVGSRFHARDGKIKHSKLERSRLLDIYILSINKPIFNFHGDDWRRPGLKYGNTSRFTYSRLTHACFRPMAVALSLMSTHILIPFLHRHSLVTRTRHVEYSNWVRALLLNRWMPSGMEIYAKVEWGLGRQKRWKCRKGNVEEFRPFTTCYSNWEGENCAACASLCSILRAFVTFSPRPQNGLMKLVNVTQK